MGTENPGGASGFDINSINRNDLAVMVAGVLAFIASFFPFYGVSFDTGIPGYSGDSSVKAWNSYGWLGVLLLLAAAALIAIVTFARSSLPTLPVGVHLLAAALAGLGTLILILRAFTYDSVDLPGVSAGPKWGAYVLFVIGIAMTVFAVLGSRESGEKMPNFGHGGGHSGGPAAPPPPPPTA